mgnify:CR=1 FL=1
MTKIYTAKAIALICLLIAQLAIAQQNDSLGRIAGIVLPLQDVTISAALDGIVEKIYAGEGQRLSKNKPILKLDDASDTLTIQRYQKVLEKRRYDDTSSKKLFNDEIISEGQALESAIELAIANLDLQQAQLQQNLKMVRAPFDGVLAKLHIEAGEWIDQGEPVADYIDTKQILVRFVAAPRFAARLKVGDSFHVFSGAENGAESRTGKVNFIDPIIDAQSGLRRIHLLVENKDYSLIAGQRVFVAQMTSTTPLKP